MCLKVFFQNVHLMNCGQLIASVIEFSSLISGPLTSNHWTSTCPLLFLYTIKDTCEKGWKTLKCAVDNDMLAFSLLISGLAFKWKRYTHFVYFVSLSGHKVKGRSTYNVCIYSSVVGIVWWENDRSKGFKNRRGGNMSDKGVHKALLSCTSWISQCSQGCHINVKSNGNWQYLHIVIF